MEPIFKKINTPEKDRDPYLKKSWWKNESNYYWRCTPGRSINYSQEFIDKMEVMVAAVKSLDGGCFLRLIPDE